MKAGRTVLIAEDEANMRRVLSALLARDGFRTLEAADGEAALESLAREPVDAILTDLRMPKMNGLELLEVVRRRHPDIPVVMLTAHGTVGSAVEALKRGAFDYLTKPFDPDEIRQVMDKAVSTRRLARGSPPTRIPSRCCSARANGCARCATWSSGSRRRRPRS